MKIISDALELKQELRECKGAIGYVATMGALHEGHISLIKAARSANEIVVVSIFVNPTQFLVGEDLDKYPRRDEADKKICELAGVDFLFMPKAEDLYFEDEVKIAAPNVRGYILEGATRPGHFSGVLRVVMKLLNIVNPANAYFGKKDAQQLHLIELMVKHYFMDVNIVAVDTLRDSDGLALSSRNVYLSKEQRQEALKISKSLYMASSMVSRGIVDVKVIQKEMYNILAPLEIGYVAILSRDFKAIEKVELGNTVILVEAVVGTTRLLDNIWL
ncbi:MAG: pantoate--beta-alanine ligase [Epsilonproteobacteria bacterium]|nr:pantoate--beta-alanine ligase [Campylobacterota bacterium]